MCETGDYKPEIDGRMVGPLLELVKNKYNIAGLASMAAKAEAAKEERALGKAPKPSPKGSALQPARKAASQGNKNRG